MSIRNHILLFAQAVGVWFAFWLLGLPDYYQQYSTTTLAVGAVLLSVAISLVAIAVLLRGSPRSRSTRAFWIAFYFTLPLALLDAIYCGVYLGHGVGFFRMYWYLTVFYITPWLTFPPTAALLNRIAKPLTTDVGGEAQ